MSSGARRWNPRQFPRDVLRLGVAAVLAIAACTGPAPERAREKQAAATPSCSPADARSLVEEFGQRLKQVSLLAPDSTVAREIRAAYAPYVTRELLESWRHDPARAPGRKASSPWPDRIQVLKIEPANDASCEVTGDVVYATSVTPTQDETGLREPVTLRVVKDGAWRIAAYEVTAPPGADSSPSSPASDAADVIRRYYDAINRRDFRSAYELWGESGAASGQTFEEFAAGFAATRRVTLDVGEPGPIGAAAGSRYVTIPVTIRAESVKGEHQAFEGTYTLRRSVVDGATAQQRRWHIYSAHIVPSR